MAVMDDGPHEIEVEAPDENGLIHIYCKTCPEFNTNATDPMFVEAIVTRHGITTGQINLGD